MSTLSMRLSVAIGVLVNAEKMAGSGVGPGYTSQVLAARASVAGLLDDVDRLEKSNPPYEGPQCYGDEPDSFVAIELARVSPYLDAAHDAITGALIAYKTAHAALLKEPLPLGANRDEWVKDQIRRGEPILHAARELADMRGALDILIAQHNVR